MREQYYVLLAEHRVAALQSGNDVRRRGRLGWELAQTQPQPGLQLRERLDTRRAVRAQPREVDARSGQHASEDTRPDVHDPAVWPQRVLQVELDDARWVLPRGSVRRRKGTRVNHIEHDDAAAFGVELLDDSLLRCRFKPRRWHVKYDPVVKV